MKMYIIPLFYLYVAIFWYICNMQQFRHYKKMMSMSHFLWDCPLVTLMSACSGRNYNFRCLNVVLLACFCASQRVQRRKAELTLAQIGEKLPNGWADWHQIWHTCADSYGNGYTPNKLPLETQGGTWGGVLGGQQLKRMGSCPIGTNFGSPLRIHLGMDIG